MQSENKVSETSVETAAFKYGMLDGPALPKWMKFKHLLSTPQQAVIKVDREVMDSDSVAHSNANLSQHHGVQIKDFAYPGPSEDV